MKLCAIIFALTTFITSAVSKDDRELYIQALRDAEKDLANLYYMRNYNPIPLSELEQFAKTLGVTNVTPGLLHSPSCYICKEMIKKLKNCLPVEIVEEFFCSAFLIFGNSRTDTDFCKKMLDIHKPTVNFIIDNKDRLDPDLACSIFMFNQECSAPLSWSLEIPSLETYKVPEECSDTSEAFQIVHITDPHLQPNYEPLTVTDCDDILCCKKNIGNPENGLDAGQWGDYRKCDTSLPMFEHTLHFIKDNFPNAKYIYYTGDIIDHTEWNSSISSNSEIITYTFQKLAEIFPDKPILPIIGNHEAQVANKFSPPDVSDPNLNQKWLYSLLAKLWQPWLEPEALKTVEEEGYYTMELTPKLRIITLNNNLCFKFNLWLLYDTEFIKTQLSWLIEILEEAEANEQFVHLLIHIPPGDYECVIAWEETYNNLVNRYSHIIKGQFWGHMHSDEIKVFRRHNDSKPINVGYNGGAFTPYEGYNPNFRVYTIDPKNFEVIEADTYIFNLTEANANPSEGPRYFKSYSMKEEYNLEDLKPESVAKLTDKLFTDASVFGKYRANYVKRGDPALEAGCDEGCVQYVKCRAVTTLTFKSYYPECN